MGSERFERYLAEAEKELKQGTSTYPHHVARAAVWAQLAQAAKDEPAEDEPEEAPEPPDWAQTPATVDRLPAPSERLREELPGPPNTGGPELDPGDDEGWRVPSTQRNPHRLRRGVAATRLGPYL